MAERRRQYYTDQTLQGYLLGGLVVMEILLVCLMLWLMHAEIKDIIEAHLYRVHVKPSGAWPELFSVLSMVMAAFLLMNVLILYLAHSFWGRYLKNTVKHFSVVLDKLLSREFNGLAVTLKRQHPAAALMELWFEKERARNLRIQSLLSMLTAYEQKPLLPDDRQEIHNILREYRRLLKAD